MLYYTEINLETVHSPYCLTHLESLQFLPFAFLLIFGPLYVC